MRLEVGMLVPVVAALLTRHASALPATTHDDKQTCGFASCHPLKAGMVNVHVIPHSHDNVGWLKTVDQYFHGLNSSIYIANVSEIISSVTQELWKNPDRRFIQVETAYLWMWWQQQSEEVRERYRQLVQSGRVQITGGGWSMHDEATTNYQSLIDNFSWGFKFLNDTFGPCGVPNVGWQIGPYGHSRETASIMAAMGLQGVFLGRLHYQDIGNRRPTRTMEMVWHGSSTLGPRADLFTSTLYDGYGPPTGCCWDVRCSDPDIGKDPTKLVASFVKYVYKVYKAYTTKNILMTMGDDFTYMNATRYYTNIDKIIKLVNDNQKNGSKINVIYSTPSCYVKAVNDAGPTLPTKADDFLPYATDDGTLWTGFYSSRPTLKYFVRLGNNFLQVCKQLSSLAGKTSAGSLQRLDALRRAMGVLQHYNAVTGTAQQHVVRDYAKILSAAMHDCGELAQTALNSLMSPTKVVQEVEAKWCHLSNVSQCEVSERSGNFVVTVYNPLSKNVSHYVRLPVTEGTYTVTSLDGVVQTVQMVPVPSPLEDLSSRRSAAVQELVFRAVDVPPLGFCAYNVSKTSSSPAATTRRHRRQVEDTFIGNSDITVKIDSDTGLLKYIVTNGTQMAVRQNFYYFESRYDGGAYAFKPRTTEPIEAAEKATFTVYKGDLVEEIHQIFNDWISQVIRVYKDDHHAEFEWLVGPVPGEPYGKEVLSIFSTDLNTSETFYTDSNGRELLQRRLNYRPTWNVSIYEPVSANYFPVPSRILIKDEEEGLQFAVLTDRSQGGSSLENGQVELMIHRRLLTDDFRGLNEAFNDSEPARGKHFVFAGRDSSAGGPTLDSRQRLQAERNMLQPWVFLTPASSWPSGYHHQFSGLRRSLPEGVHVLTLEPWGGDTILLRLEHFLGPSDDPELSQSVTINVEDLFVPFAVTSLKEATLDGSQWLSDVKKFNWTTSEGSTDGEAVQPIKGYSVSLDPMQIRTFVVSVMYGA